MEKQELLGELHSNVHKAQDIWFYAKESGFLHEVWTADYPNGVMAEIEGQLKKIHDVMEILVTQQVGSNKE